MEVYTANEELFLYHTNQNIEDMSDPFESGPTEIFAEVLIKSELSDIKFDIEDFLNTNKNDVSIINNNINHSPTATVTAKPAASSPILTGYSSFLCPSSPSGSWISEEDVEDFPEEVEDLHESNEDLSDIKVLEEFRVPVFNMDVKEEETEDMDAKDDDSEDSKLNLEAEGRGRRVRFKSRTYSPESTDSDTDSDWEPEDFVEVKRNTKTIKKELTSDGESEECDFNELKASPPAKRTSSGRKRVPSKNPIPQQRKKGSKQKISQWIVSLLRDPATNPTVITWEHEPSGKFRVTDSAEFARKWGEVKKNKKMNYEKLSRAMRYYYKNKEIKMVKGERLTYAFGPNMRDFRAKDRNNPNFEKVSRR